MFVNIYFDVYLIIVFPRVNTSYSQPIANKLQVKTIKMDFLTC
jgi:hypothetical protein